MGNIITIINTFICSIFYQIPDNIAICINNETTSSKIFQKLNGKRCENIDCSECYDNCSYIHNCSENLIEDNNIYKCKCLLEKCFQYSLEILNNYLCSECCDNNYQLENDPLNISEYINCYKEGPKGFYLDIIYHLYKKCYHTCETCDIGGDNIIHNCIKCNANFIYSINISNYFNCYVNCSSTSFPYQYNEKCVSFCPYGYYIDNSQKICCSLQNCSNCTKESLNRNLCTACNNEYYPIYNNSLESEYFDCYQDLDGYKFLSC